MRRLARLTLAGALVLALAGPAAAVQPDEVLEDPALEARAREISKDLRCLVCRNESIDESNAALARDLRLLVRERLLAGDSDAEVVAYVVSGDDSFAGYGEYVLLRPTASGSSLLLWLAAPLMLLGGLTIAGLYLRGRRGRGEPEAAPLSPDEARRLEALLRE
jgi:cytochrome c-type biogenesis protein CcmH